MGLSKLNRSAAHKWAINTEGFTYKKASEMPLDTVIPLAGCFISRDNGYGKGAVLITHEEFVNIPQRYVEQIEEILKNPEYIQQIEQGGAAFSISTFQNKQKKLCYSINFIDV